ncbi:MAG: hypothetical protein KJO38_04230 [Gammaproteobacteria bacterium]|nr:hypothetical protein [Gammaproteobacteria bacterium]
MTEFVISATYVLVPLFVFIPMLAKYIDIKHATIQAARYEAWEYTAWQHRPDDHDILDNYESDVTGYRHPFKTPGETRNESMLRFLTAVGSDPYDRASVPLPDSTDRLDTWDTGGVRNPLWRDHLGRSMFDGVVVESLRDTSADTPSLTLFGVNIGDVYDVLLDIVDFAFELLAGILDVIDQIGDYLGDEDASLDPKFSAINTDGYSRVELATRVNVRTDTYALRDRLTGGPPGADTTLDFSAKAGVLAEGWGAGGTEHTYLQVNGATPSILVKELLDLPVLDEVWDLISFIAPELSECTNADDPEPPLFRSPFAGPEGNFWPGYVDGDVVHPDRLSVAGEDPSERLGGHVCDSSGRCIWDDDVRDLGVSNSMEPLSHSPCIP